MKLDTSLFGPLEITEEKIIHFPEGLPGFEHLKQFFIVILDQTRPFMWLQAIDEDISIPVISPFDIDRDYSPTVDDGIFKELKLEKEADLLVLVVSLIPAEVNLMTANLAAPVLINIVENIGKQVIAEGNEYQVRQPIFEAVSRFLNEEDHDASTDEAQR